MIYSKPFFTVSKSYNLTRLMIHDSNYQATRDLNFDSLTFEKSIIRKRSILITEGNLL